MALGKIMFGVLLIIISISIYFAIMGDALKVFIDTPSEREAYREAFRSLQGIYFLTTIGLGVLLIVWGATS